MTTTKVDSSITFSGNPEELPGLWFHMDMKILLDGTLQSDSRQCAYAASLFRGQALQWLARRQAQNNTTLSNYASFKAGVNATWGMSEEALRIRNEREIIRLQAHPGQIQSFNAKFEVLANDLGLQNLSKGLLYTSKLPTDYQDRIIVTGRETSYPAVSQAAARIDLSLSAIRGAKPKEGKSHNSSGKNKSKKQKESKSHGGGGNKAQGGGGTAPPTPAPGRATVKAEVNMISVRGADTGASTASGYVNLNICGARRKAFLDGGSQVNCLRPSFAIGYKTDASNVQLIGPNGSIIQDHAMFIVSPVDGIPQRFYLVDGLIEEAILGRPYLDKARALDVFSVDTDGEWVGGGRLRPLSVPEEEAQDKYLAEALANKWIRPSTSDRPANILFVEKGNGKLRFCVDYRALNAVTKRDQYPIPLLWDILRRAMAYRWFTVMDGKAAFHRLTVRPGDEHKLAFKTNRGNYEYLVMPFGVTNGPSYQQRFMDSILLPHQDYCCCYLDDIVVFSNTREEHDAQVSAIKNTLAEYNIQINDDKTQSCKEQVVLLGHWLSHDKIEARIDVDAIRYWKVPSDKTELLSFLGLANWYRNMCPNLGAAASPLYSLTGKTGWAHWGPREKAAMDEVKDILVHSMTLHRFRLDHDLHIYTDASMLGTGALLVQDGHLIAVISKGLLEAEKNYTTTERELLAVVRAVKAWRHYIESTKRRILVLTDHKSITQDLNSKGDNRRFNRWLLLLGQYPIEYHYCPGKDNPADFPSRAGFMTPSPASSETCSPIDSQSFGDDDWENAMGDGYWDSNGGSPQWVPT